MTPQRSGERARLDRLDDGAIVGARHDRLLVALARIEDGGLRPVRDHQSLKGDRPMSITAERKQTLIGEYAVKDGDTGSPEVQVAILSRTHPQPDRPSRHA